MTHKTKCKDAYGNVVPCNFKCKTLWGTPFVINPKDWPDISFDPGDWSINDGGGGTLFLPRMESILDLLKIFSSIALEKFLGYIKLFARVSMGWVTSILKWALYDSVMHIADEYGNVFGQEDLRSGNIDLNIYVESIYKSILDNSVLPDFVVDYIPKEVPDFASAKIHIPELKVLFDRIEQFGKSPPVNTFWFFFGFVPDDLIPIEEWIYDAGGYITDKGITGSEYFDDIFSIILIFIPGGGVISLLESFHDTLLDMTKYLRIYNDLADGYNALRTRITSELLLMVDDFAGWVDEVLTNSSLDIVGVDDMLLPFYNEVKLGIMSLSERFNILPEMPVFPDYIIEHFERTEWSAMEHGLTFQEVLANFQDVIDNNQEFRENWPAIQQAISVWLDDMDEFLRFINEEDYNDNQEGGSSSSDGPGDYGEGDNPSQDGGEVPDKVRYLE
jgi:hypothetical protein